MAEIPETVGKPLALVLAHRPLHSITLCLMLGVLEPTGETRGREL